MSRVDIPIRVRIVRLLGSMLLVVGGASYAVACGSNPDSPSGDPSPLVPPGTTFSASGGPAEAAPYAKLSIQPASAVVTVDIGQSTPAIKFVAKGVKHDGTEENVTGGAWNFTRIDAAAFE